MDIIPYPIDKLMFRCHSSVGQAHTRFSGERSITCLSESKPNTFWRGSRALFEQQLYTDWRKVLSGCANNGFF
jgi:hypothetical protein